MNYQYTLNIGDRSCDGHNQSEKFTFNCTHSDKEIHKAYKDAAMKSGISLTDNIKRTECILEEYEDRKISIQQMNKLIGIGVSLENMGDVEFNDWEPDKEKWSYSVHPQGCAQLFLEMVRSQLPEFKYEFIKLNVLPYYMGYGCFN